MAHIALKDTQISISEYFAFVGKKIAEDFAKGRMYRKTLNELSALNGAELADIGLTRSEIRRVALEAAYGK